MLRIEGDRIVGVGALLLDGLLGSTRELTREAGRRVIAAGAAPRLVEL